MAEAIGDETKFVDLYSRVLDTMMSEEVDENEVKRAISEIKLNFKSLQVMTIDFKDTVYLIGYFYTYSTLNTVVARDRFLDAFKNCPELKKCINKSNLDIVSLGGGPGTDWIAFCSALQQSVQGNTVRELRLTIVELFEQWEEFFKVIEDLVKNNNFGLVSDFYGSKEVNSTFSSFDLKNQDMLNDVLKNADIMLLVRVLDVYQYTDDTPNIILKNIGNGMKDDALLIIIDTMKHKDTKCFELQIGNYFPQFGLERVYKSSLGAFIKSDSLEMYEKNKQRFYTNPAMTSNANVYVFKKK